MPRETHLLLAIVLSPLLAAGAASAQSFSARPALLPSGPVLELPEILVEGEAPGPSATLLLPAHERSESSPIPLRDNFRRQLLGSATAL